MAALGDLLASVLNQNMTAWRSSLEVVAEGELSVVCFRHLMKRDASDEERNRFNAALLKRSITRKKVYLSNATLEGKFCLRACIVNHLTKESDIDAVVPEVLAAAQEVGASY